MSEILIVDDDPSQIDRFKEFLKPLDLGILYTIYPKYIFEILKSKRVSLILLDIHMPEITGMEILDELRISPETREIPVIMLTADQDTEMLRMCFEKGAYDFVNKSANEVVLISRVKAALEKKRLMDQMKEFVGIVAHDLRSPISAIYTLVRYYKPQTGSEALHESLKEAASKARELVCDLVDMMAVETGRIQVQPKPCKINDIFNTILSTFEPLAQKNQIRLSSYIEDPQTLVLADAKRINQVLSNLIANALKFTPNYGKIQILCQKQEKDWKISVIDNGIGMKPELICGLFDKHTKSSRPGARGESGTGFGLPLSQELIQAHGSVIEVESKENHGSSFSFILKDGR